MKRFKRQVVFGTFSLVFLLSMLILPMQLGENMVFLQTRKTIAVIQTSSDRATAVAIDEMDLSQFEHPISTFK